MQKRGKTACAILLACLMVFNITMAASAVEPTVEPLASSDNGIAPCFVALQACGRGLSLENSDGLLCILACTDTYPGYTASTTALLQVKSGSSWVGVTSWTAANGTTGAEIGEHYTVDHGTYRTLCTHRAYDASGNIVETFVEYSDEVTY